MACGLCEHCLSPVSVDDGIAVRDGFSYHKKCLKCYVCSETNLHNAEVFKGVIFCSSCAQRIFQSCASVRRNKLQAAGRAKRSGSKPRRKRERSRPQERKPEKGINGVLELAQLAGSTSDSSRFNAPTKLALAKKQAMVTEMALQAAKDVIPDYNILRGYDKEALKEIGAPDAMFQPPKTVKKDSVEMGTTTEVTQEVLKRLKNNVIDSLFKPISPPLQRSPVTPRTISPKRPRKKRRNISPPQPDKPICSDLRIAAIKPPNHLEAGLEPAAFLFTELGASTEIANMTLRKKSEVPVIINSENHLKQMKSYSLSVLNQESVASRDGHVSLDSAYSTFNASLATKCLDRRLGSILKMPYRFFKKNILNRSSLVSVLMSTNHEDKMTLFKRLKMLFYEEIAEHQGRGMRRLYSTIHRRKTPYRLGWLHLVANVSRAVLGQSKSGDNNTPRKVCKHVSNSHSYRCMRAQAMKSAGPTRSQLACMRKRIKRIVAPRLVRKIARCLCDVEEEKRERPKDFDLQTVYKATSTRKENKLQKLGKKYVHLWSMVV